MAICIPAMCRTALPTTRMLLETLGRSGVIRADGCVITSTGIGGPPEGYDRVSTMLRAGCRPLDESREQRIRSVVAAEVTALVAEYAPGDCMDCRVVEAIYSLAPDYGAELVIEIHGLVDHQVRVFLD